MPINLRNVSFSYRKDSPLVIDDVSLNIKEGTVNILLGLNGSGKTTLIKLLSGMLKANKGIIEYDGKEINDISIHERSKIFAYVSQKGISANDFKVKDYLTYGFASSLKFYQSPTKEQLDKAESLGERFKITHLLEKDISQISGGERQIVSIIAALIQDTPIIILDEPTSALDLANQSLVLNVLKGIAGEGKTIILSSHNPNHALYLDADVFLLKNGKLMKEGPSSSIINKETLSDIYGNNVCYSKDLEYEEISFK